MNLQPLEDRIVVRPAEAEETTVSGLVIPDTAKEKPQQGEVLAVGPGPSLRAHRRAHPRRRRRRRHRPLLEVRRHRDHRRRRGPPRPLEPRRARQGRQRARRSSRRHPRPGARGGRQRIPRPATARAGAAGALGFTARRAPVTLGRSPPSGVARCRFADHVPPPHADRIAAGRPAPPRCSLPIFEEDGEARLVLTKRPETMPSHQGEIAFPGGKLEPARRPRRRATPRCARRRRRSGSRRDAVDVVAELDRSAPSSASSRSRRSSGSPTAGPARDRRPREVDRVFDVALSELLDRRRVPRGALGRSGRDGPSGHALLRARGRDGLGRDRPDPHRLPRPRRRRRVTGDWGDWTRA